MDHKEHPEQEKELSMEELFPTAQPEDSLPVIEELTFAPSMQPEEILLPEDMPAEEPAASEEPKPASEEAPVVLELFPEENPIPEETVSEADVPVEEVIPVPECTEEALQDEEAAFVIGQPENEPVPVSMLPEELTPAVPSFMDRIPDVEEPSSGEIVPSVEISSVEDDLDLSEFEMPAPVPQEQEAELTADQEYRDVVPAAEESAPANGKKKKKEDPRPTRKGRPRRKKGEGFFGIPNILATVVWLGLIVAIGVTLGRMLWVCAADVLAFGREDKKVTVTVYEADTMEDIIDKLHANGLIRYKSLFRLYADISDAEEEIKPGIYDLNTRYDYHALVNFMSPSSTRQVIELTIPEGYTCRQIFALLEENRVCTAVDIASFAADGELSDYWFLENVARGSEYCLEGYLFPDTYQFYKNSTPKEALEKMLDNFEYRFSEEMRAQIDTLNANVTDGSFTVNEVVIVASLIEKESAAPAESPTIASVIYNRLYNWEYPALLNIDAAIVYAQGGEADTIDTSIDSPYNTYRYTGLTPTPISNPGLSSLKAALSPESTDYYFYVLNPATGTHQFSTTQAEHDGWISKFYN